MKKDVKVGIALGGGSARGLAHIGVLRALEEHDLAPDIISGTSIGSIIGAIYASGMRAHKIYNRFKELIDSDFFKSLKIDTIAMEGDDLSGSISFSFKRFVRMGVILTASLTRQSVFSEQEFIELIDFLIPDLKIEELQKPFCAVALDILSGQKYYFETGSLREAVMASSAIPGLFPPVELDGKRFVDGGWVENVPVFAPVHTMSDMVIAVDVTNELENTKELTTGFNIMERANSITRHYLKELQLSSADTILRPPVRDINWADFYKLDVLADIGYKSTLGHIDEIENAVKARYASAFLKRFLGS